jgi:hypothetical protein
MYEFRVNGSLSKMTGKEGDLAPPMYEFRVNGSLSKMTGKEGDLAPPMSVLVTTLLNYHCERGSAGVARIINACERLLMRAERRSSADLQLKPHARVGCPDGTRRLCSDPHLRIGWRDRNIAGEPTSEAYVYCYKNLGPLLRCHCR